MDLTIFIILLCASAFFSGSETAFLSLDKLRFKQIEGIDRPSSRKVIKLLKDPHRLLVTILIGNTLVNIAASAILADYFYTRFGETGIILSIVIMTIVVLIFGEVTPKRFAFLNAKKFSFFAGYPLAVLEVIFTPVRLVLTECAMGIVKSVGLKIHTARPKVTEQEIRSLLHVGKEKGVVKEKEKDMIDSILEFKDLNAADIMSPRIDIMALDVTKTKEELSKEIRESQYSRYPVYVHTLDNIVGVIHSKEFLLSNGDVSIKELIKSPFFVPESMKIDDVLNSLQKEHTHMAIVTDEYGVTSGVVTIEDVLEEIVGEIRDEFDFEQPNIRKVDRKNFIVNGQTHIDEVNDHLGLMIDTDEVDTIGGYVILKIGKIPQAGDKIEVNDFIITVNDVSKNRITSVNIEKISED